MAQRGDRRPSFWDNRLAESNPFDATDNEKDKVVLGDVEIAERIRQGSVPDIHGEAEALAIARKGGWEIDALMAQMEMERVAQNAKQGFFDLNFNNPKHFTSLCCNFTPTRTVLISIGFDEEGGAEQSYGARCLAENILERYGEDEIEMIFDEGIAGIERHFSTEFALPATAEKGYMDIQIKLNTVGGHSSTPPDHSAIGYLALAIHAIKAAPFKSQLTNDNPTTVFLRNIALYSKRMPLSLRIAVLDPSTSDEVLKYMDSSSERRALVRTSTAVDIIRGGEKANALPETAYAVVNHGIAVEDSTQLLRDRYIITLTGRSELEVSPVTKYGDVRFKWLVGTIRSVFGKDVYVTPVLLTGNTDTKFYWRLSSQIYRMSPWRASLDRRGSNIHTLDERMPVEGLLEMTRFYHEFIRVVDEQRR